MNSINKYSIIFIYIIKTLKIYNFIFILISSILIINSFTYNASAQKLIITGSLAEMYDDNTNSSSNDPKSDYITNLMLGIGVNLEGKTQTLRILAHTYQQLYYKQTELNNNSQDLILNYTKAFTSHDSISISDVFNHYPEPRDFKYMYGQPEGRNAYYSNNINAAYNKNINSDLSLNLHYSNMIIENFNKELSDSITNSAGFTLNFSLNAYNIVSTLYDYRITKYKRTHAVVEENQADITQHSAGIGYQHLFTKQLSILCNGGVDYVKSQDQTNKNPFITLSIIDDIDARNQINLTISKRYETSFLTNEIYDSWTFSAMLTRQVSEIVSFSFSMFYGYGERVSPSIKSSTSFFGINTSIRYQLNPYLFASTNYIYTKNIMKQTEPSRNKNEYDRNQIQVAINAEF
jgi:hypothetical protein